MADFGALTMVGLIATVLSIGFAFAAFVNSRRRLEKKQAPVKEGPPGLPFLGPNEPAQVNARTESTHYYSTASRQVSGSEQAKPAFKQVQAIGTQSGQKDPSNSDEYVWE